MLASYKNNASLFERCMALIDKVFPGCKAMAKRGDEYGAAWSEVSTPFIIEEGGAIIAHLGVIPIDFTLNGKAQKVAAFHGICVDPAHRGKGLFKQLMGEAFDYCAGRFDSTILFTDKPELYFSFGFKVKEESNFVRSIKHNCAKVDTLKILNFDDKDDLNLLKDFLNNHIPLSKHVNVEENTLFILNMLDKPCYYSKDLGLILSYSVANEMLTLEYVMAKQKVSLEDIAALIPNKFNKVSVKFYPDMFNDSDFTPVLADTDGKIMVLDTFEYKDSKFRYPEPFRC
jgi:GNAT superfamily N-acetyltransferase